MTKDQWKLAAGLALAFGFWALRQGYKCDKPALKSVPPDSEFDKEDLALGASVEMEHTGSRKTAKQIAKHHLLEDPEYYQKLATIHHD
jgi:hypothetical protein